MSPAGTANPTVNAMPGPPHTSAQRFIDPDVSDDERLWATLVHISGLPVIIPPPLSFVIPLILWLVKREKSPYIDDHGKEAVNFHLSLAIWMTLSGVLTMCGIGFLMIPVLYVLGIVMAILCAIRANRGEYVRYPITIRFLG